MCSHNRAIHPKVEDIKIIRNRGMGSSRITRSKVEGIKVILSRDTLNKAIPNKDMPNSKTISNRAIANHNRQILPEKVLRPKKRRP